MIQITNIVNDKLKNLYTLINKKPPITLPKYTGKILQIKTLNKNSLFKDNELFIKQHQENDIEIENLQSNTDGDIIINNKYIYRVFFIYKKKMYLNGNPENKFFHLCCCKYLKNVNPQNYTATSIPSLFFPREYEQSDFSWETKLEPLKLCRDCFDILNLKSRKYNLSNFDIKRYYLEEIERRHNPNKLFDKFRNNDAKKNYVFNWNKIRDFTLKNQYFTCQKCGQKFADSLEEYHLKYNKNSPKYLEVHHRNKNKHDNSIANLQVLCNICHDMEHPFRPK